MSSADRQPVPARTLALASGAALVAALLILLLFVLPAERGIDPSGIGARLGLMQMRAPAAAPALPAASAAAAPTSAAAPDKASISKSTPLRSDDITVRIAPHSGLEIKAEMKAGDHLIFRWTASAPVKMDMHGERPNAGDEFTRYWMESDLPGGQGAFTAPFDGRHGWYFRNKGEQPATVKLHTAGFYAALVQPKP